MINIAIAILCIYAILSGLVHAKGFFMPITVAALLSMLLAPLSNKIERWKLNKAISSFISVLLLLIASVIISFVFIIQVDNFSNNIPSMYNNLKPKIMQLKGYIYDKTGITYIEQEDKLASMIEDRMKGIGSAAVIVLENIRNFIEAMLLTFVYTFFFLLYRHRFSGFILRLVPEDQREQAENTIFKSSKIAQQYLFGRIILILFLAIIYYIGFSIVGIQHTLFLSGLVAVLSIVPYLGNLIGLVVALTVGFLTGLGLSQLLALIIIFSIVQFIESYLLEPYIVGQRVALNAVMTILAIVLGGAVWGAVGVIIALPVVGIIKVICDQVPQLHAFGFLLGEEGDPAMDKLKALNKRLARWILP